jgi:predicted DNA-binding transcriptional regulator AlpA
MSIQVEGVTYFSVADIQRDLGIPRQTIWRWRKARHIPQGRLYRGKQLVFTKDEVEEIRKYANRLEPVNDTTQRRRQRRPARSRSH